MITPSATTVKIPKSTKRYSKSLSSPIAAPGFWAWTIEKNPGMILISSWGLSWV